MKKASGKVPEALYRGRESNPYERFGSQDFKSCVSTSSTTPALAI